MRVIKYSAIQQNAQLCHVTCRYKRHKHLHRNLLEICTKCIKKYFYLFISLNRPYSIIKVRKFVEKFKELLRKFEINNVHKAFFSLSLRPNSIDTSLDIPQMLNLEHMFMYFQEKEKLLHEAEEKEERLKKEKEMKDALSKKISAMESKLLVGGGNIVDHTNEQQRALEKRRQEIADQKVCGGYSFERKFRVFGKSRRFFI